MEGQNKIKKIWGKPGIIEISIRNKTMGGSKNRTATENSTNKTHS